MYTYIIYRIYLHPWHIFINLICIKFSLCIVVMSEISLMLNKIIFEINLVNVYFHNFHKYQISELKHIFLIKALVH